METYINIILNQYDIKGKYIVDQEYDPYNNIYYVNIFTNDQTENKLTLSSVLLEHHEEFIFNLDRIIIQVYPNYIKSTLNINYFQNKIWISFIPVILDLHVITMNAVTSKNEYKLKGLMMHLYSLSKNKYNIHHHIFYNPKEQYIKRFNFDGKNYEVLWHKVSMNTDIRTLLSFIDLNIDDVIMIVPQATRLTDLPIEIYDIYENKIKHLDIIKDTVYVTKYLYLK